MRAHQLAANDYEASVGVAVADAHLGRTEQAKETLRQLARLNPNSAWTRIGLAELLHQRGQLEFAKDQLNEALQLEPDNLRAKQDLAIIAYDQAKKTGRRQDWYQCAQQCTLLSNASPYDVQVYLRLGLSLYQYGQTNAALKALTSALSLAPNNANVHAALSLVLQSAGQTKLAAEHARTALSLDPHQATAKAVLNKVSK